MYFQQQPTVWTLGHGDRNMEDFWALLAANEITTLVDIRSHPRSRRNPHFDEAPLRQVLMELGCHYHWAGRAFGGLRQARAQSRHPALAASTHAQGFADHMDSAFFRKSATQLINLARRGHTALLCAELDYRRCHRRLLADYLILSGVEVLHITGNGEIVSHLLSPEARRESAEVIYDRNVSGRLDI